MSGAAWFIGVLLVYDVGVAAIGRFAPGVFSQLSRFCAISDRPFRFYALMLGLTTVAYLPLVAIFGAYHWLNVGPFWLYGSRLLVYPIYFALGIGLGGAGLEKSMVAPGSALGRQWLAWTVTGVAAFLAAGNLQLYSLKHHTIGDPVWRMIVGVGWSLSCASLSFMMMALFVRFARPNRLLDSLSANAYGMYLTHYAIVQWSVFALLTSPMRPELKAVVVFLVAATGSWLLTVALRKVPAVARII
jgi:surface polysaccharide O-acyltransferase-like enzyme